MGYWEERQDWQSDGAGGWVTREELRDFANDAIDGKMEKVKAALAVKPGLARARDKYGATALMRCAFYGNVEAIKALLPLSDPLARDLDGGTALMRAASEGRFDAARLLLPESDPRAIDKDGNSALTHAAGWGNEECVELLLPVSDLGVRGRIVIGEETRRLTAEEMARARGHMSIADLIRDYGKALSEREALSRELGREPGRGPAARRM